MQRKAHVKQYFLVCVMKLDQSSFQVPLFSVVFLKKQGLPVLTSLLLFMNAFLAMSWKTEEGTGKAYTLSSQVKKKGTFIYLFLYDFSSTVYTASGEEEHHFVLTTNEPLTALSCPSCLSCSSSSSSTMILGRDL